MGKIDKQQVRELKCALGVHHWEVCNLIFPKLIQLQFNPYSYVRVCLSTKEEDVIVKAVACKYCRLFKNERVPLSEAGRQQDVPLLF